MTLTQAGPVGVQRRDRRLLISLSAAIVAVLAVTGLALRGHHKPFSWQQLPQPSQVNGATIGSGGGTGNGTVTIDTHAGQVNLDVVCRGTGLLTMKVGSMLAKVQCFTGKTAEYQLASPSTNVSDVTVRVDADTSWKIVVAG